ncbi:S-adenosylmethionine-dependent methyltransferase [Trifolium pratense]|uniref:S-adenosylmethionine-dependent methyltransferase n=1 Tax=Trifolium pratense TaxID=57577 RepID=A0A2K3PC91_TRIPR|nr:S-adenosylmethionine-dependent methyltransferase [Trifolium pratense]
MEKHLLGEVNPLNGSQLPRGGPEKEFELMKGFLKPVLGGNIIDASCGSGLFSRLFAKSGLFSLVVALDYSENMLRQCYEFVQQEDNFPKENFILVRADIARLPFVSSSVDAVHAGAAIHCWPSPSAAVAEISRVLRPGGVFVATTYILDGPFRAVPFLNTFRQSIRQLSGIYTVLSERELEALCKACGLQAAEVLKPFTETWRTATAVSDHVSHQNLVTWSRPLEGTICLNVDGSLLGSSQSAGFGGLIRNNDGTFLGGFYGVASQPSILYAEIMAMLHGLELCWEKGFWSVSCFSDSLQTVTLVKNGCLASYEA